MDLLVTNKDDYFNIIGYPFNKFNSMLEKISNKLDVFSEEIILIISKEIFR